MGTLFAVINPTAPRWAASWLVQPEGGPLSPSWVGGVHVGPAGSWALVRAVAWEEMGAHIY